MNLMDFTDAVLAAYPCIDQDRVCMGGGSYGGFMANWIIGHTDRFKAVASCRSISNYISKCLTTDIGYYHNMAQMKADPWTAPEKMWAHSPLAYANKAVTVVWGCVWGVLIFHEHLTPGKIVGALMVLSGVAIYGWADGKAGSHE